MYTYIYTYIHMCTYTYKKFFTSIFFINVTLFFFISNIYTHCNSSNRWIFFFYMYTICMYMYLYIYLCLYIYTYILFLLDADIRRLDERCVSSDNWRKRSLNTKWFSAFSALKGLCSIYIYFKFARTNTRKFIHIKIKLNVW